MLFHAARCALARGPLASVLLGIFSLAAGQRATVNLHLVTQNSVSTWAARVPNAAAVKLSPQAFSLGGQVAVRITRVHTETQQPKEARWADILLQTQPRALTVDVSGTPSDAHLVLEGASVRLPGGAVSVDGEGAFKMGASAAALAVASVRGSIGGIPVNAAGVEIPARVSGLQGTLTASGSQYEIVAHSNLHVPLSNVAAAVGSSAEYAGASLISGLNLHGLGVLSEADVLEEFAQARAPPSRAPPP